MCCQESGEREATVSLLCPKAAPGEPKMRKVACTRTQFTLITTAGDRLSGNSRAPVTHVGQFSLSRWSLGPRSTACAGRAPPSRRTPLCRKRSHASSTTDRSPSNCEALARCFPFARFLTTARCRQSKRETRSQKSTR